MVLLTSQGSVEVKISEETAKGVYSNNVVISHNAEEFVMDFMFIAPNSGTVNARVIVSPEHAKRIMAALKDNIAKYEKSFGKIQDLARPETKPASYH
ncbi:MAG: DUF3467 domain-containing protein [Firmicutes bacterium]|nr:DUF3467 domain-containing protein [Bacillota bacterium]